MFRGSFHRDLAAMTADLVRDPRFHTLLPALLTNPARALADTANFAAFLDEYERRMPPSSTLLCGWTADGAHENYGPGPRPDAWSFLADLAVWFSVGRQAESALHRPGPIADLAGDREMFVGSNAGPAVQRTRPAGRSVRGPPAEDDAESGTREEPLRRCGRDRKESGSLVLRRDGGVLPDRGDLAHRINA